MPVDILMNQNRLNLANEETYLCNKNTARCLRCDFHTHTPASHDTIALNGVTESDWLSAFMKKNIDLVAVTDHNTAAWIDPLKREYSRMKRSSYAGFRDLLLLPGVEITSSEGIHLLAVFPPSEGSSIITQLLDNIGSPKESRGDAFCHATACFLDIISIIIFMGGTPIPAHIDRKRGKGLFNLDFHTLQKIISSDLIHVVESIGNESDWPGQLSKNPFSWMVISGSDCHSMSLTEPYSRFPGCISTMILIPDFSPDTVWPGLFAEKNDVIRDIPDYYRE